MASTIGDWDCPLTRQLLSLGSAHWRRASQELHKLQCWLKQQMHRPSWAQECGLSATLEEALGTHPGNKLQAFSAHPRKRLSRGHMSRAVPCSGDGGQCWTDWEQDPAGARQSPPGFCD